MLKIFTASLLFSLSYFCCNAQKGIHAESKNFQFITNTDSFLNLQNKPQKPYFLYFTASWCAPCRQLQSITFTDPNVVNYVNENAIALKVDVDKDNILKQKYYVSEYPTVLIFDKNGAMKMRFEGFFTSDSFLEILKKVDK